MYKKLKVVHLNTWDFVGGAAKGVYTLHKKLLSIGVDSTLLVQYKTVKDDSIIQIYDQDEILFRENLDSLPVRLYGVHPYTISSSLIDSQKLLNKIEEINPDIVHLHWVCRSFLSVEDIAKIKQPIIWTLRDWWAMSGGCHHPLDCTNYQNNCGGCHLLKNDNDQDITYENLQRKKKSFSKKNITVVGISQHMVDDARRSSLFKDFDVRLIYNAIDEESFYQISKVDAKENLGIVTHKKIISIGANSLNDKHKGLNYFLKAMRLLNKKDILILFFGKTDIKLLQKLNCEFIDFGYIDDKNILRNIYAASDAFVAPSLFEPFGKTVAESMASGTPVVCFENAGGPSEIVAHKIDGYVAKKYDFEDLSDGVNWILYHQNYKLLSDQASASIKRFSSTKIAYKYIELYQEKISSFEMMCKHIDNCDQSICLHKLDIFYLLYKRLDALLPINKKYIIYGYGYFGMYVKSILKNRHIIFADKDANKTDGVHIVLPAEIKYIDYEKIIIAVLGGSKEIRECLKELKVADNKIIDINSLVLI